MSAHPLIEGRPRGGKPGVTLTTIGSRGVRVRVEASPMRDAGPGDKTVWLDLLDGPLAVTFTANEAAWLVGRLRTRPATAEAITALNARIAQDQASDAQARWSALHGGYT
ncbi:MAG TPA: hypothetical protein VK691_05510 [Solirubrobacteraceae bacterium]|jgi:hypothetical protein|nr:hypothetical protein [Solirubrobacteraceae bacterium]